MNIAEKAAALLSLEGKVAIISGAASGIGFGIATKLAQMGASVVLLDINEENGRRAAAEINSLINVKTQEAPRIIFIKCDVRSHTDCQNAASATIQRFGRIDILCNNAGIVIRKDVVALAEEEWDLAVDVTLKGVYLLSRHVIPHMIRSGGGSVINTGSGWSLKGGPKAASYCAAKGGVLNLTKAMAIDYGRDNVRVNCVCPGDIDTPMLRSECTQLGEDIAQFMKESANRPIQRVGIPEDVANAVLFLASDMSKWVTGTALVVDGGGLA